MKHHILIIEDDSVLVRGLKDNFINAGFQVSVAMDGESGLNLALDKNPDLVLLDLMLPKIDGYNVCREIRAAERDMPIIMLTANGQEDQIVHSLNSGADDYVTKPFGIRELVARVNAFLRRKPLIENELKFVDFVLDKKSRKLTKQGREISLTPKEFSLLLLFIAREGTSLTRETILNHVWKSSFLTTQRSVDRCVNTLRKKIEGDPANPQFIHSIREFGYKFELPKTSD